MSVGKVRTGILLILIGTFLLLNTLDVLDVHLWENLLVFWPVFLIAIGIEKIFGASDRLKPLAYISPLLIVATFAYAVVAGPSGEPTWGENDPVSDTMEWRVGSDPSIQRVDLKVDFGGGRLVVGGGTGQGSLLEGRFQHRGRKPVVSTAQEGGTLAVSISQPHGAQGHITLGRRDRERWTVRLNDSTPVNLSLDAGGAMVRLDLASLVLQKLKVSTGAADVDLVLGAKSPRVDCTIECGAASIDMTIPATAGLRLTRDIALSSLSTGGIELVKRGDCRETPDFETKPVQIIMEIEAGVSSLRIHQSTESAPSGST
jgi:hypothetical protein